MPAALPVAAGGFFSHDFVIQRIALDRHAARFLDQPANLRHLNSCGESQPASW